MGKVIDVQIDSIRQEVDVEVGKGGDVFVRFLTPKKAEQDNVYDEEEK